MKSSQIRNSMLNFSTHSKQFGGATKAHWFRWKIAGLSMDCCVSIHRVNWVTQSFRYLLPLDSYRKFENRTTHVRVENAPSQSICTKTWKKNATLLHYIIAKCFIQFFKWYLPISEHQFQPFCNPFSIVLFFGSQIELNWIFFQNNSTKQINALFASILEITFSLVFNKFASNWKTIFFVSHKMSTL